MNDVSVLVVDDSAVMRRLVGRIVDSAPGLRLADKAMNGRFALQKLDTADPDVIVLDIEMPEMNGIEFLKERKRRGITIPVVVLSSIAKKGAQVTMEALSLGASDFVTKPSGPESADIHTVAEQLIELLRNLGREYRHRNRGETTPEPVKTTPAPPPPVTPEAKPGPIEIVAIGISTGGPNALRKVFAEITGDLSVPLVVVQHMPAGFTEEFAHSLDRVSQLEVKEAREGDVLKPGRALIAPGDRHITVERRSLSGVVHVTEDAHRNGHRPSADVLFESVAKEYGNRVLGIIMTGMGKDGAVQLGEIRRRGGITIGQDAASCVVYGMPKVAFELGHVVHQLPLSEIAGAVGRLVKEHR